jgi:uncharacterized cupredoxin-like copper-binding protein
MSVYILGILGTCSFLVFASTFFCRSKETTMSYMVFVMAYSMCFGLSIGFYLGAFYQEKILLSTVLSVLFSGIVGLLIGARFHLYTMIEGLFSGIMAGLMGAMLTPMMTSEDSHFITLISILLTVGIAFLCIFQFLSESLDTFIQKYFNFFIIIGCGVLVTVFFKFPDHMIAAKENQTNPHSQHSDSEEKRKESDLNKPSKQPPEKAINWKVDIKGNKYFPSDLVLKENKRVVLTLNNNDSIEHDIEISPFSFKTLDNSDEHSNHKHSASIDDQQVFHLHVNPNETNQISFIPKEAGVFTYYCTIPGHKEAGMIGKIKIS